MKAERSFIHLYCVANNLTFLLLRFFIRDRSPSPKAGRRYSDDPFAIPGYREARDRYRDEHADSSDRVPNSPYGRPHDEVPAKKLRPDYDFLPLPRDPYAPLAGKPVEAPIDCEIIIINKQQM